MQLCTLHVVIIIIYLQPLDCVYNVVLELKLVQVQDHLLLCLDISEQQLLLVVLQQLKY